MVQHYDHHLHERGQTSCYGGGSYTISSSEDDYRVREESGLALGAVGINNMVGDPCPRLLFSSLTWKFQGIQQPQGKEAAVHYVDARQISCL